MPLSVVLRRLLLIMILVLPQWFWIRRSSRLAARWRQHRIKWIAGAFLAAAVAAMVFVLYDRIVHKFLPVGISLWIAPLVQLWIVTSTFTFFCLKILQFFAWVWLKTRTALSLIATQAPENPSRRLIPAPRGNRGNQRTIFRSRIRLRHRTASL